MISEKRNKIAKLIGLLLALLVIYGVAIPFIMSDEFDKLAIQYGLDKLGFEIFWR
jgi:hypothetical protein